MIDAAEAYRVGLVNRVVPAGESAVDAARGLLRSMLANAPLALAGCIAVVNRGMELPLDEALALEADAFSQLTGSDDAREGTSAFLEKRAPAFRGS
jgi:enoyl-CoA hydratase